LRPDGRRTPRHPRPRLRQAVRDGSACPAAAPVQPAQQGGRAELPRGAARDTRRPPGGKGSLIMPLVYACSASHAPGITAWTEAAPKDKKDAVYGAFATLREGLAASGADVAVIFAPEHFANFFLDNMPAFCVGRGAHHMAPVEP